jgi:3-carboxy-cis,cis-muconate cycloisomerase
MDALPDFDPGFTTAAMRTIWSSSARVRRWCDAEAALAHAASSAGLAPLESANAIEAACAGLVVDPEVLLTEGWSAGTPIVPLLHALRALLPAGAAEHLHLGATSQDIMDTGVVLQLRDGMGELTRLLDATADALVAVVERHPHDLVLGRTLLQPALPTRFALRVASWLEPLLELAQAIDVARAALPAQLGGPVGDLGAFGAHADRVVTAFARRLELSVPLVPWHTDRRPIVSAVYLATRAATQAEKIASDLVLLAQAEVAEVTLPAAGSSSMAHKKNPMLAIHAVSAARACHGVAGVVLHASPHAFERAAGSWQAEAFAVPLTFQAAGAAVDAVRVSIAGMALDPEQASRNLARAGVPPAADLSAADALVTRVLERYRRERRR